MLLFNHQTEECFRNYENVEYFKCLSVFFYRNFHKAKAAAKTLSSTF